MIWALDQNGMRVNARFTSGSQNLSCGAILTSPCCHQKVIYVKPSAKHQKNARKAYFRHPAHCNCEYAKNKEYHIALHWDIIDELEANSENPPLWKKFIMKNHQLSFFRKLSLRSPEHFHRETILENSLYRKRADIIINKNAIEIQCSPISDEEVIERELVYAANNLNTYWILGFTPGQNLKNKVQFPYDTGSKIRNLTLKGYKRYTKFVKWVQKGKISLVFGLSLSKWQKVLIQNHRVLGIYFKGQFISKFAIFETYIHVPKQYFEGACKKKSFLLI
jgi:Competence protein CoiA-like family